MKGVIFTEYLEFIEDKFGYQLVDQLLSQSELKSGGVYTAIGSYDFNEMVTLLVKTCELTSEKPDSILRMFGRHVYHFFIKSYPIFFETARSSFDLLSTLDDKIHPEVLKLYPDAELPRFDTESMDETTLVLIYKSSRKMSDFAEGLMEACLDHFNEKGRIEKEQLDEHGEICRFTIIKTS
jgi:hypothetical protein